jgi:HNH endonuclease
MSPLDRLLLKVRSQPDSECWEVFTSPSQKYAYIRVGPRKLKAHRFMYQLVYGDLEEDQVVMHKCHNKKCVNPEHLQAGTQQENILQSVAIGRHMKGRVSASTRMKGVRWMKNRACVASAWVNGKTITLYYGPDFFEACCARKAWERDNGVEP